MTERRLQRKVLQEEVVAKIYYLTIWTTNYTYYFEHCCFGLHLPMNHYCILLHAAAVVFSSLLSSNFSQDSNGARRRGFFVSVYASKLVYVYIALICAEYYSSITV